MDGAARRLINAMPKGDLEIQIAVANAVMEFTVDESE